MLSIISYKTDKPTRDDMRDLLAKKKFTQSDGKSALIAYVIFGLDHKEHKVLTVHKEMSQEPKDQKSIAEDFKANIFPKFVKTLLERKEPCYAATIMKTYYTDDRYTEKPAFIRWIPKGTPPLTASLIGSITKQISTPYQLNMSKVIQAMETDDITWDNINQRV